MTGTTEGGKLTARTVKKIHGSDYYARIGAIGGKAKGKKGFALNPALASIAGAKGGATSRRTKPSHCPQGHELNSENKYEYGNKYRCRACRRAYNRRKWALKKETRA